MSRGLRRAIEEDIRLTGKMIEAEKTLHKVEMLMLELETDPTKKEMLALRFVGDLTSRILEDSIRDMGAIR